MTKVFLMSLFLLATGVASANGGAWTCSQGGKLALTITTTFEMEYEIQIENPAIASYLGVPASFESFSMNAPNDGLLVIPGEFATGVLLSHDNGGMRLSSAWVDRENDRYVTGNFWYFHPGECVQQ